MASADLSDNVADRPRIFISFSGPRSREVALKLETLLSAVFGDRVVVFTSANVSAGTFAWEAVRRQLSEYDFGVLCLTAENQINPWLMFEAGALSKHLNARLVPYLIDETLTLSSKSPLSSLGVEPLRAIEEDTQKLVKEIAERFTLPLDDTARKNLVVWWNELSKLLGNLRGPDSKLAPSLLPEIHEISWRIEARPGQDFRRWLRNQILWDARNATLDGTEGKSSGMGEQEYRDEVFRLLKADNPHPEMTILALCGEKGFRKKAGDAYFREFYEFAGNHPRKGEVGRISVCRIFVEREATSDPTQGEDRVVMAEVIAGHRARAGDGVMALTISKEGRETLDGRYPGFTNRLDAGFGFVVFYTPDKTTAITHEGQGANLAFSKMDAALNLRTILDLFKRLCKLANEYKESDYRQRLDSLFVDIQPDNA